MRNLLLVLLLFGAARAMGDRLWDEGFSMPRGGMSNPYELSAPMLDAHIKNGKLHALQWPVEITAALLPYYPTRCFLNADCLTALDVPAGNSLDPNSYNLKLLNRDLIVRFDMPLADIYRDMSGRLVPLEPIAREMELLSFDRWTEWLGLYHYPESEGSGVFYVPYPGGQKPDYRMGVSLIDKYGTKGLTFSCAACHSETLFGRPILGLSTRFSRTNQLFYHGSRAIKYLNPTLFELVTGASKAEIQILKDLKKGMRLVDSRVPQALGLDTSLAQVGLSLRRRSLEFRLGLQDTNLSWDVERRDVPNFPVSDSKPAVWWNVKFKNRWLSDGSLVSGNPVLTNYLWNEIGRGSDLNALEQWIGDNDQIVKEVTAMVYASQAPHITDFFSADEIDINAAKRGEKLFGQYCEKCHGKYIKNWSLENAPEMMPADRLKTHRVEYFENTKVVDVGTDPARYEGMTLLLPLNDLDISRKNGMKLRVSDGYVPPPLVGIWARWPYFHNNAVPTLCDVLEPVSERPKVYYAMPAKDKRKDFDLLCNGYPKHGNESGAPAAHLLDPRRYDTAKAGMSNIGHDRGVTTINDRYVLSAGDKHDLVTFLQTL